MRALVFGLFVLLGGCSTYSPSLHEEGNKQVVYRLSVEQAKKLVSTTMASHFAGREVLPLAEPAIGYTTYTRMLLDTWSTTVTILPVRARLGSEEFEAVKVDVQGSGSSFVTGRAIYENFKERLRSNLDATASMRAVDSSMLQ